MKVLKLPNMNEFSPGVVGELPPLLKIVRECSGDRARLRRSIAEVFDSIRKTPAAQRLNRANNVLIGMSECGLFDLDADQLTSFGESIADLAGPECHEAFAKHLLTERNASDIFSAADSIRARHEKVTLQAMRDELRARGFVTTTNESNASKVRQWLELAGLSDKNYVLNTERYATVLGIRRDTQTEWHSLPRGHRALLVTLRELAGSDTATWQNGRQLRKLTQATHGAAALPEASLRKKVLDPLERAGWIQTRGKGSGRGGDIGDIRPTAKLLDIATTLSVDVPTGIIPQELIDLQSTPLEKVLIDLRSSSTHTKGVALELLALRLTRALSLQPLGFRLRGTTTQGAEVDLIAEGLHLHFSRWLFQCKNTSAVTLSDLAKEIGMALLLKAHVIVMVTTGRFASSVLQHAKGLAETTPLQALLIDGNDLRALLEHGSDRLFDLIKAQAARILTLKRPQVIEEIKHGAEE